MVPTAQVSQAAIDAALQCKWEIAKDLNTNILNESPDDVCALNRLARACFELGSVEDAKEYYQKVLELDPYNAVALKNIKRLATLKDRAQSVRVSNSMLLSFIEEPGKTKIVELVKTATPDVLVSLRTGEEVKLIAKSRGVQVCCADETYIGRLPDDVAFHLMQLLQMGNKYQTYLKLILHNKVYVFIKEHYRNENVMPYPSFPQFSAQTVYALAEEPIDAGV